ncbi:DUF4251 domain-containing protein [Pedobacter punctiformis]|uniref:DUF4251 domain-containing protein n=1 Tax=Pedobacter punctiformis TaxID=3004097 RepID=A0ABT4LB95_9SPHI|nr:DUF4251 domain-containing protein [Pedobacter sp. HCMS5-2]MCZ4245184.1 DUF4251 domain-containing protein [Pedobacter sp. HCMS5-2]
MKHLKYLMSVLLIAVTAQGFAQTDKETTVRIVGDKNFIFIANSAMAMASMEISRIMTKMPGGQSAGTINLSGAQYDLKITPDSIVAYLPYYGRSFNAPMDPTEGGIKFTSKDFTYQESKSKKGSYTIQINTKDVKRENYRLTLNVSTNGYATLNASSVNKQPITFNGYISEPKKKEIK